jgi:hypothetical protein
MTDDEKTALRAAIILLGNATSNSLDPSTRKGWEDDRETVCRRLTEMVR